jgi:hypothetical protein
MKPQPSAGAVGAEILSAKPVPIAEAAIGGDLGTVYTHDNRENRVYAP